jgi:hypothetical protein
LTAKTIDTIFQLITCCARITKRIKQSQSRIHFTRQPNQPPTSCYVNKLPTFIVIINHLSSLTTNHNTEVKRQTTLAFRDGLLFGMKWDNTAQRMMVENAGGRPAKEID